MRLHEKAIPFLAAIGGLVVTGGADGLVRPPKGKGPPGAGAGRGGRARVRQGLAACRPLPGPLPHNRRQACCPANPRRERCP